MAVISGCERAEPIEWTSSKAVTQLEGQLVAEIQKIVKENSGTAAAPKLVSDKKPDFDFSQHLLHGQAVYMHRCVQCHGVNGDGNGPAASHLYPRPRDYTKGMFKFTSTPYGIKPRREDLIDTLNRGINGTSMPKFDLLPRKDLEAVVDYVIVLSQRGELELMLSQEAEASEELDPDFVPEFIDDVINRWKVAKTSLTQPLTPQPELTEDRAKKGREAFLSKGCSKCHGDDGRGQTNFAFPPDSWGYPTFAADLTSGMLRGGQEPIDIYRRILNGINGTPMPSHKVALAGEPDVIWDLVAYVQEISNQRRLGKPIPAGLVKPYGTTESAAQNSTPAAAEE
ncbi:MAG: c-type cytochrome [Planctomycetaceae bacterium]|nr:c-type cytochrome [Planctomycetaceae bacterium]